MSSRRRLFHFLASTTKPRCAGMTSLLGSAESTLALQTSMSSMMVTLGEVFSYEPFDGTVTSLCVHFGNVDPILTLESETLSMVTTLGSADSINSLIAEADSMQVHLGSAESILASVVSATSMTVSFSSAQSILALTPSSQSVMAMHGTTDAVLTNCYEVYTQVDGEDARLRACLPAGTDEATLTGHQALWDGLVWVLAVSKCGVTQTDPAIKRQAAFDADDLLIGQRPDVPSLVSLVPTADGEMLLSWSFIKRASKPLPTAFKVYLNVDDAGFDFDADPAAVINYVAASRFNKTLGPWSTGTAVQAVVRAVSEYGAETNNTAAVTATADATPPAAPASVTWGVTP